MEPLLDRLTRHPGRTLAIAGALLALSLAANLDFRPSLDLKGFVPDGAQPESHVALALGKIFRQADALLVVLESPTPVPVESAAEVIQELERELRSVDGVERIRARLPAAVRRYQTDVLPGKLLLFLDPSELKDLADRLSRKNIRRRIDSLGRTVNRDPLGLQGLAATVSRRIGAASPLRFVDGYMADRSLRRYFVLVEPRRGTLDLEGDLRLVDGVRAALARVRTADRTRLAELGLRIYAVGRAIAHVEGYRAWRADAVKSIGLSLALVYLLFAVCFRRPFAAALVLAPIAFSASGAILAGRWMYGEVHLLTVVFCVLLVGLGIDFAFHIASHYWLLPPGSGPGSPRGRLVYAVERPLRGIVLGGLTTAAAFVALEASSYPVIRQTGAVVAIGIGLLLATSLLFVPVLLYVWPEAPAPPARRSAGWPALLRPLSGLHTTRRRRVAGWAALATLVVLAAPGVSRLRFDPDTQRVLAQGNEAAEALDRLTRHLGISFYPLVVVSPGSTRARALEADQTFFRRLLDAGNRSGISLVDSLSARVPSAMRQAEAAAYLREHVPSFDPAAFRRRYDAALEEFGGAFDDYLRRVYPERIARALDVRPTPITLETLEARGLGDEVDRHLRLVGGTWYAATYLYPRRYPWKEGALAPFLRFWESLAPSPDGPRILRGNALRGDEHRRAIRADAKQVLLLAVVLVAGVLWAGVRSAKALLKTMAPVTLGVWLLAGVMGAAGIGVHFLTLCVLPILFGVGVDDGIHVAERFRRGESFAEILAEAGPGLVMTSATTVAAFLSMLAAANPGIREFGFCGALGVALCLATSLLFLPLFYPPGADTRAADVTERPG